MKPGVLTACLLAIPALAHAGDAGWHVYLSFEAQNFAIRSTSTGVEALTSHGGRVTRRAVGPAPETLLAAWRGVETAAKISPARLPLAAWQVQPSALAEADYFAVVGSSVVLAGVRDQAGREVLALLDAARRAAQDLPAAESAGLYLLAFPVAAPDPGTPAISHDPPGTAGAGPLGQACARPGAAVRVAETSERRGLPKQMMFTLSVPGPRFFTIQYWQGAPFSLAEWLRE